MAIAIGGGSNARSPHGQFWVDVRDYGARAGGGFDNAPAFQAAHDTLAAKLAAAPPGQRWTGTVFVPGNSQPYNVGTTVFLDASNITFAGEGSGTTIQSGGLNHDNVGTVNCPIFTVGYMRPATMGGAFFARYATYRPDLFGKLDTTIATGTGQRWGFRTNTDAFIMSHASPASAGGLSSALPGYIDYWAETQTLTIEFAVEGFASGKVPANTMICGIGDQGGNLYPFQVYTDGSANFKLDFQTQAVRFGPAGGYGMSFPQASGGGVQRISIEIDLVHGIVTGWVNGIQQYTGTGINNMRPGACFRENDDYPFCIAGSGLYESWGQTFNDFALYGILLSKTLRYNVSTNGSTQVRTADSVSYASIHDNYRYNDDWSDWGNGSSTGLVAFMPFSELPSENNPMLNMAGNRTTSAGASPAFLGWNGQLTSPIGASGQQIRDMRLLNILRFSTPIYLHSSLDVHLSGLDLNGGMYALADLPFQSNYTLLIDKCQFSSSGDAAIYLCIATARMTDCEIHNGGRANLRLRETNLMLDGLFIAGCNSGCQFSIVRTHAGPTGGGNLTLRQINQDLEGGPFPTRAALMLEAGPTESFVRLEEISAGDNPGVPFLLLDSTGTGPNWPPNTVNADNAFPWLNSVSSYVQSNGLKWTGEFKNMGLGQSPHLSSLETYAKGAPFKFRDNTYPAPPHAGSWYPGPHRLDVPLPADGQYTEWRCSKTGTYGTATPPSWVGLNAIQASPQSLAAYAFDHTAVATSAYGGSSYGWYADNLTASALQKLFGGQGGQDMSVPTTLSFGLAMAVPLKSGGVPTEPSGSNYARASLTNNLTNFPSAPAGTKTNATAITWPSLSGTINNVVGFFVTDQSNRFLAYIQFASPQSFASGTAPTLGIGAFTLTQMPLNLKGGLSQYGWGKIADCYFGGAALAPPTTWYVGLNTAHASASSAPTEPSGNAYARVGLANDASHWATNYGQGDYVAAWNVLTPTFAIPTGSGWGTILGATLADAASAGNSWFVGDAPNPVAAGVGSAATVAPSALLITI